LRLNPENGTGHRATYCLLEWLAALRFISCKQYLARCLAAMVVDSAATIYMLE
jgi:hypothetical protein